MTRERKLGSNDVAVKVRIDNTLSDREFGLAVDFLEGQAYWNRWRSREQMRSQFEGAWKIYAAREETHGALLGLVRVSSDGVSYGYIADCFVFPEHRGKGVGSVLLRHIVADRDAADFRWMLHTADAQSLYASVGFIPYGPTYMERPSRHAQG